ncbi:MAG: hypothetical protein IPN67_15245 [Bacteroidales bacterium]|nr:hypothetical protein [Bacteroidales bacterium]
MELFKNVRLKIGKVILSNKVARLKRNVYYSGFSKVRNIGIVWDASKTSEFSSLNRFHQRMADNKIDLTVLGYYPGKNLPDQYTAIRFLTCIKKDEINSFYHPDSTETHSFINNPFDILIDINFDKQFPLSYVTELSKARLKVGLFDNETAPSPFDLMMEVKKPADVDVYLNDIIHYLEMIKDKPNKKVD